MLSAAYLQDQPLSLEQPDGSRVDCLVSGDEYYNRFHDQDGYTITRSPASGYLVYAELLEAQLVPGPLIAGKDDPRSRNLQPGLMISEAEYLAKREAWRPDRNNRSTPTSGSINNIVVYIRFSDQDEFTRLKANDLALFNSTDPATPSFKGYYLEASYGSLSVTSHLLPTQSTSTIVSYQDIYPRGYYLPQDPLSNPGGYTGENRVDRERGLISRATAFVHSMLPPGLDLDINNDGRVDNIIYFLRGTTSGWGEILWPHQSALGSYVVNLGTKTVYNYNVNLESMASLGILCHEFGHSLGAQDYYPYYTYRVPAGQWELMSNHQEPPQHFSSYLKWHYFGWIDDIPLISAPGLYSLDPLSSSASAYRIASPNPDEYFILEYRRQEGLYDTSLPGSGLLVWRVDSTIYNGNELATTPELYAFRPDGTVDSDGNISQAPFSIEAGRIAFNNSTNPACFLSDGSVGNVQLFNIGSAGSSLSFRLGTAFTDFSINPVTESFNGSAFPLTWTSSAVSGSQVFNQVSSGVNPGCSPYSAQGMLTYPSHEVASGHAAILVSPRMVIENYSTARYSAAFMIFRDDGSPTLADRIEVYRNNTAGLSGSPTLLGTVHRSRSLSPSGADFGWNQYSFSLDFPANGDYYLIFKAIGAGGNNIYIDDIKLERHCHAQLSNFSPADNATMISINPSFSWNRSGLAPSGYKISLGTDNPPSNLMDAVDYGNVTGFSSPFTLAANTRYYWQAVPWDQYGNGMQVPVLSFRTACLAAVDPPLLEDFESPAVPNLPAGWGIAKSSSSNSFWQTAVSASPPSGSQVLQSGSEWLISRGINLQAETDYRISFQCRLQSGVTSAFVDLYISDSFDPGDPKTRIIRQSASSSFMEAATSISISGSGIKYFIFYSTNPTLIDDFKVMTLLSVSLVNPIPATGATEVSLNPSLSWQLASGNPSGFLISFGTDNPPTNIAHQADLGYSFNWNSPIQLGYGSTYYWSLTPYDAQGEAINNPVWSFSTLSTAILPLNENLDTQTAPQIPQGWTVIGLDNDTNHWQTSTTNHYSPPNCLRVKRNPDQASNDWLISPPIDLFSGFTYRLQFRYRAEAFSPSERLQIAYGTAPDPSQLTSVIFTATSIGNTTYSNALVDFSPAQDGVFYVGFRSYGIASAAERYLYLDDILLKSYSLPSEILNPYPLSEAQNHPINRYLSWEHNGDLTGFKIYLGTDNPPTNLVNGLDIGPQTHFDPGQMWDYDTSYYWKIHPFNSAGYSSAPQVFSFHTMPADEITYLPYCEGFDSATTPQLPGGYLAEDSNQDSLGWITSGTSTQVLRINSSPSIGTTDWIFLPAMQMQATVTYTYSVFMRQGMVGKTIGMRAALFSAPASGFEIISLHENLAVSFSNLHQIEQFSHVASSDAMVYLGIQCVAGPNQGYLSIDEIRIRQALVPVQAVYPLDGALGIHNQPSIFWSVPPVQPVGYKLYLGTDDPPSNILNGLYLPNVNEYQLTQSLGFGYTCYWKVVPYDYQYDAENCPVFSFTVMPSNTILQMPYLQGFENGDPPHLPQDIIVIDANEDGSSWNCSQSAPSTGSNSAYNSSSPDGQDDWLILPPLYLKAGFQYQLGFRARKSDSAYHPSLRVFTGLSPNPANLTDQIASLYLSSQEYGDYSYGIDADISGAVYIGFRAYGWPASSGIYLDDISLAQLSSPLYPPRNLSAVSSYTTIELSWEAPLGRALLAYKVYRDGILIANLPASQTTYSDTWLSPGTDYTYYVKAAYQDPEGDSDSSNLVSASLYVDPPSPYLWQEDFADEPFDQGEYQSWTTDNPYWGLQPSTHAGGASPEVCFSGAPGVSGTYTLLSPYIETMFYDELALSFCHRIDHLTGVSLLKLDCVVGSDIYPIAAWNAADLSARTELFYLSTVQHGIGFQFPIRLAWTVSGDPASIASWCLDDIALIRDFSILGVASPVVTATLTEAGNILLSWDPVSGASSYRIYSSPLPEGDSWTVIHDTIATQWQCAAGEQHRFFKVTAVR